MLSLGAKYLNFNNKFAGLRQRGGAALLPAPPDGHPLRRLVCHPLEHRYTAEVPDHRRGFLCSDYGPVRTAHQALQYRTLFLRHATKETII